MSDAPEPKTQSDPQAPESEKRESDKTEPDAERALLKGVPGHVDLYLLMAGLIVGFIASPWCLGRVDNQLYERVFLGRPAPGSVAKGVGLAGALMPDPWTGVSEHAQKMVEMQKRHDDGRERLKDTDSALADFELSAEAEMKEARELFLELQRVKETYIKNHEHKLNTIMMGLLLAGLFIMSLESLVSPEAPLAWDQWRGRLIHIRFLLFAGLLALTIARPGFITDGLLTWVAAGAGGLGLLISAPWLLKRS